MFVLYLKLKQSLSEILYYFLLSFTANQRIEQLSDKNCTNNKNNVSGSNDYIPSQAFLTALVQIFPTIFQNIKTR